MVIHLVSRFLYSDIPDMTNATKNILFPGCFIMGEGLRPWGTYRSPTGLYNYGLGIGNPEGFYNRIIHLGVMSSGVWTKFDGKYQ